MFPSEIDRLFAKSAGPLEIPPIRSLLTLKPEELIKLKRHIQHSRTLIRPAPPLFPPSPVKVRPEPALSDFERQEKERKENEEKVAAFELKVRMRNRRIVEQRKAQISSGAAPVAAKPENPPVRPATAPAAESPEMAQYRKLKEKRHQEELERRKRRDEKLKRIERKKLEEKKAAEARQRADEEKIQEGGNSLKEKLGKFLSSQDQNKSASRKRKSKKSSKKSKKEFSPPEVPQKTPALSPEEIEKARIFMAEKRIKDRQIAAAEKRTKKAAEKRRVAGILRLERESRERARKSLTELIGPGWEEKSKKFLKAPEDPREDSETEEDRKFRDTQEIEPLADEEEAPAKENRQRPESAERSARNHGEEDSQYENVADRLNSLLNFADSLISKTRGAPGSHKKKTGKINRKRNENEKENMPDSQDAAVERALSHLNRSESAEDFPSNSRLPSAVLASRLSTVEHQANRFAMRMAGFLEKQKRIQEDQESEQERLRLEAAQRALQQIPMPEKHRTMNDFPPAVFLSDVSSVHELLEMRRQEEARRIDTIMRAYAAPQLYGGYAWRGIARQPFWQPQLELRYTRPDQAPIERISVGEGE